MNKKLLAAAVAAAVAASPGVFAESTIYGKMHASVDAIDYETSNEDNYEVQSRSSRLGFKGSEDLGGGLRAIYQIELSVNAGGGCQGQGCDDSGLGGKTRNTFVGLAGDWGTFLVGRHDTPAKMAFHASGNERLGDSVIDLNLGNNLTGAPNPNAPIGVFHEYRADNTIAYISPSFSGFNVVAAIIPGEDSGNKTNTPATSMYVPAGPNANTLVTTPASSCKNQRDGIADDWSVGAMYTGNGLKASMGYASYDLDQCDSSNSDDYEVAQVGASYTFNNFSFGGQYEDSSNVAGVKNTDYEAWAVTGKATFGNNAVSVVYTGAEIDAAGNADDLDRDGWGLAAEHNFSKRTKVYAAYASGEVDYDSASPNSDEDNDVFSLGMIHNF